MRHVSSATDKKTTQNHATDNNKHAVAKVPAGTHHQEGEEMSLRDLSAATVSAMRVISNINQLSTLDVAGNVDGQIPTSSSSLAFNMITSVLEASWLPKLSLKITAETRFFGPTAIDEVPVTPPATPGAVPAATLTFPTQLPPTTANVYEVQQAILYANPLPLSQTQLRCIDSTTFKYVSSPVGPLPLNASVADVSGQFYMGSLWNVTSFGRRPCRVIGSAVIVDFRVPQTSEKFNRLLDDYPAMIRLPYNPALHRERGVVDQFSGLSSIPSCVLWDEKEGEWTADGITHVTYNDYNMKSKPGSEGPYVECLSSRLGIFAVSEVPRDCHGVAHGSALYDYCGVCGGDNSTCSGCDGEPNTGRTKRCSGHGACKGNMCACDLGWQGVNCHVKCSQSNCSDAGTCVVNFTQMSFNSTIYCDCAKAYFQPVGALRCDLIEVYVYVMPPGLFFFLVAGVPILLCGVLTTAAIYYVAKRQANSVIGMKRDIDHFAKTYEESNNAIEVEAMEVNADLCMPIMEGSQARAMVSAAEVLDTNSSSSTGDGKDEGKPRVSKQLVAKDVGPLPISEARRQRDVSCM